MFRTGAQFMIIVLVMGLFLMRESRSDLIGALDESFADFLSRNSRRTEQPAPLTLVEIDDGSLNEHPLPWTPLDFALFFQAANAFHPDVLATDETLKWDAPSHQRDNKLPQYKKILREHILRSPKVLLGARLGFPEDSQVIPPLQETPLIRKIKGDISGIPEFTSIEAQAEEEFRLSSTVGFTNVPDSRQAHHSAPLLFRYRGQLVPSFALQAVLLWEKLTTDDVSVEAGVRLTLNSQIDIPIDERGRMRVDFGVPRNRCTLDDLVLASAQVEAQRTPMLAPSHFDGKLLLLSRTDKAARTLPLAMARRGAQGELTAAAIATIQNRSFLQRAPIWFDCALIAIAVLVGGFIPRWRKGYTAFGAVVFIIGYILAAIAAFGTNLTWVPIVLPAGLALFIAIFRAVSPDFYYPPPR